MQRFYFFAHDQPSTHFVALVCAAPQMWVAFIQHIELTCMISDKYKYGIIREVILKEPYCYKLEVSPELSHFIFFHIAPLCNNISIYCIPLCFYKQLCIKKAQGSAPYIKIYKELCVVTAAQLAARSACATRPISLNAKAVLSKCTSKLYNMLLRRWLAERKLYIVVCV